MAPTRGAVTARGEARAAATRGAVAAARGVPGGGKRGSDGGARGCYGASLFFLCFFWKRTTLAGEPPVTILGQDSDPHGRTLPSLEQDPLH